MKKKSLVVGIFLLIATLAFAVPVTAKPPKPEKPANLQAVGDIEGDGVAYGHWDGPATFYLGYKFDVPGERDFTGWHDGYFVIHIKTGSKRTGQKASFMFYYWEDIDGDSINERVKFYTVEFSGNVEKGKKEHTINYDNVEIFLFVTFYDENGCVVGDEPYRDTTLTFTVYIT